MEGKRNKATSSTGNQIGDQTPCGLVENETRYDRFRGFSQQFPEIIVARFIRREPIADNLIGEDLEEAIIALQLFIASLDYRFEVTRDPHFVDVRDACEHFREARTEWLYQPLEWLVENYRRILHSLRMEGVLGTEDSAALQRVAEETDMPELAVETASRIYAASIAFYPDPSVRGAVVISDYLQCHRAQ